MQRQSDSEGILTRKTSAATEESAEIGDGCRVREVRDESSPYGLVLPGSGLSDVEEMTEQERRGHDLESTLQIPRGW